jgi:sugar fermentation stimulation protein A
MALFAMLFPSPLLKGRLIQRYKRFLADIALEEGGDIITAHCPNPGAIQGLTEPGTPVWVSKSPNPARALPFTWEMAESEGTFVGMNTSHPNALVVEAIQAGLIPQLQGYPKLTREVNYGENSRIDILLSDPFAYVEVKNVHWKRGNMAAFPSSPTLRGTKHMRELSTMVEQGHKAYVVYVVQRNDCEKFELAHDIDPLYAREASLAFEKGVQSLVYACDINPKGITLVRPITFQS